MPNILSPCVWEMSAAQLITPTTSQLAVVNAIQSSVTSSTNWTVNATGTSTIGAKWIEIKPSNLNSLYKDYRILIVERVNTSTNKILAAASGDGSAFNGTSNVYFTFAPDGGAAHVTFTIANLETANDVYVGTRYKNGSSTAWACIPMPCTALWLYLCDGAFWIVDRVAGSSHFLLALGHIAASAGYSDFNTAGTEVGLSGIRKTASLTSSTMMTQAVATQYLANWFGSGTGARTFQVLQGAPGARLYTSDSNSVTNYFYGAGGATTMVFPPLAVYSTANPIIFRGVYLGFGQKTRTTIQSNGSTVGYTFYPDDAAQGTNLGTFAFLNTP